MQEKTIKLSEVIFDEGIYPRKSHDPSLVQKYADDMDSIEQNKNYIILSGNYKLLDGKHRWLAYRKLNDANDIQIPVFVYPEIVDEKDELTKAIELNSSHGWQLTKADKIQNCKVLYQKHGYTLDTICKIVRVSKGFVSNALKPIRDEERLQQDTKIFEMYLACHTQDEIANEIGLTQGLINGKINTFIKKVPKNFFNKSFKNDQNFKPPIYNVWTFAKKSNNVSHFGNSEQRILDNLLYLYTEPHDIVFDPFGGGGSTIDVCKKRLRRYFVSDRKPIVEREQEIRKLDIVTDNLPSLSWSKVQLTYLDPPYWKQAEGQYSDDKNDLANMPLDLFTKTMCNLINAVAKKQQSGYIALLIQPTQWKSENKKFNDHVVDIVSKVGNKKLALENRVSVPYSTEQYNAQMVDYAKENKKLLVITRELIIWKIGND